MENLLNEPQLIPLSWRDSRGLKCKSMEGNFYRKPVDSLKLILSIISRTHPILTEPWCCTHFRPTLIYSSSRSCYRSSVMVSMSYECRGRRFAWILLPSFLGLPSWKNFIVFENHWGSCSALVSASYSKTACF